MHLAFIFYFLGLPCISALVSRISDEMEQIPIQDSSTQGRAKTLKPWFPEATTKSLVGFARAIKCTTGRNPLDYNNYGCYCGWGGSGTPVDAIDRCCQIHDECYGKCETQGCWPKLTGYAVTCLSKNHTAVCDEEYNTECNDCGCSCDVAAAHCFRDANEHYQKGKASCKN